MCVDQHLKLAYPKAPILSYLSSESDIVALRPSRLIRVRHCRYYVLAHVHTCSVMSLSWIVISFYTLLSADDLQVLQVRETPVRQYTLQNLQKIHRLER